MKIGGISVTKTAGLAPMASVADRAFRLMAKKYGASLVCSEMVSAKGLTYSSAKSFELLTVTEAERPMAVQLFGNEPHIMAQAAKITAEYRPDFIDINMGCPVPKVASNGCGAALMKTPHLAADIVYAVAEAVDIPVTVKIRKGWDDNNVNAVEFARLMQENGCAAITVHGRTKVQMYSGASDNSIIAAVKKAVNIPVIGNGDIDSAHRAEAMYRETQCDMILVGRGSYGRPWIFNEIQSFFNTGIIPPQPTILEALDIMSEHISLICSLEGEKIGMPQARKHAAWYLRGFPGAAKLRNECCRLESYEDLRKLVGSAKSFAEE